MNNHDFCFQNHSYFRIILITKNKLYKSYNGYAEIKTEDESSFHNIYFNGKSLAINYLKNPFQQYYQVMYRIHLLCDLI